MSTETLEALIESGEVSGVLLLSDELRETITPRELDLVRQAFEAGLRFGRAACIHDADPLTSPPCSPSSA